MLSYEESLKILKETKAFLEGHYILSSGLHSPNYIQCAQLLSKPKKASILCKDLSKKILNDHKDFDLILSPAIGGIVIGYEMGRLLDKVTIFCERVNNEFCLRRDFSIKKDMRVLIVEDVITTGKSSLECDKIVKHFKAEVVGFACLIDRSNDKSKLTKKITSQIKINIPSYSPDNLPDALKKIKAVKPGSRGL